MAVAHGWKLLDQLCDALGLPDKNIRSLKIDVDVKSISIVTVESVVRDEHTAALKTVLKEYTLTEINKEKQN